MPANRMGSLFAGLSNMFARRKPGQMPAGADTGTMAGIGGMPSAGAGNPLGAGGVASVNPATTRPGGTRSVGMDAFGSQPTQPQGQPTQGIDRQRPESQTEAQRIQAWNAYRRAEKAAGRADPGQYAGQTAPS